MRNKRRNHRNDTQELVLREIAVLTAKREGLRVPKKNGYLWDLGKGLFVRRKSFFRVEIVLR